MLSDMVFAVSALIAIGAAVSIFKVREIAHAMLGFLLVTVAAAAALALLGLPLLALLQLFIMVGGVSTYLFVGVSSENLSRFRHTSLPVLVVLAVILAVVPIYRAATIPDLGSQSNGLTASTISSAVGSNLALFYMLAILLFGVGIGSIVMIRGLKAGGKR